MPQLELTLQARWVFPVDAPPIRDGCVRVGGERIRYVGPLDRQPDIDLGNAAIVPGFVNAHTHLELSNLRAKELASSSFTGWLGRVIEARRAMKPAEISRAIERGIDESLAAGTTLVGDISTGGASWRPIARSPLRAVVFCELLGLTPARATETAAIAKRFLERAIAGAPSSIPADSPCDPADSPEAANFPDGMRLARLLRPGADDSRRRLAPSLSPHAPFSTDAQLYDLAGAWGAESATPITTHLAETRQEIQLLSNRDGPLRDFLQTIGAWDPDWTPRGARATDVISGEPACRAHWLLAHGNYLSDDEIARLASPVKRADGTTARRAVAYCPRTHVYFGHARHPYSKLLAAGVTVCIGTDSLASNPTLSVLDELRFLHRREDALSGDVLLRMGTLAGAWSLRQETHVGSLAPDKSADLAVIRLPDRDDDDPHRLLFESDLPVIRTMIAGRFVYQRCA